MDTCWYNNYIISTLKTRLIVTRTRPLLSAALDVLHHQHNNIQVVRFSRLSHIVNQLHRGQLLILGKFYWQNKIGSIVEQHLKSVKQCSCFCLIFVHEKVCDFQFVPAAGKPPEVSWERILHIFNLYLTYLGTTNLVNSWFLNFSSFSSLQSWACTNDFILLLLLWTAALFVERPSNRLTLDFWVDGQTTGWEKICFAEGLSEGLASIIHW